ncbi:MAG TPA: hypothetical protein VMR41_00520 [Patescibacteria group bacterium]|nr:hypothetical protein [Patescibacteria group bacterium]
MYKSINVSPTTYQQLQQLATQLNKPKAQIIDVLVTEYEKIRSGQEEKKLTQFNKTMGAKINALAFSKKIAVTTDTIDTDFAALASSDFMREK